jgi:hypothetical protein
MKSIRAATSSDEDRLSHFPVRQQVRGAVGEAVAARREHISGVADGERLLGVLLDQQDADAALVDGDDAVEDLVHVERR